MLGTQLLVVADASPWATDSGRLLTGAGWECMPKMLCLISLGQR